MWRNNETREDTTEEREGRVEESVVEVRMEEEEERLRIAAGSSRREQGEQTVAWKEVVVSRDFFLRIIFLRIFNFFR